MSTLPTHSGVAAGDDQIAHAITHQPGQLKRTLKLRHLVFIGLAYMAPMAVFDMFGIVSDETDGHVPLAYLLVMAAVLFTAFSYSRMVRIFPIAGSAYTYVKEAINAHLGFVVGWAATLDYLLLPMINAILSAIYMGAVFPDVPFWVWVLLTVGICTVLNLVGVKLAASMNVILVLIQLVVAVLFVVFTVVNINNGANGSAYTIQPFFAEGMHTASIAAGAALLALSFLGFDAVSTLAEEAERPTKDIPRAIFLIVLVAGAFFISVT